MREGRANHVLRPISIELGAQPHAEGSALITLGATRVLCAVSVEARTVPFRRGSGLGWLTAEYAMLPRATASRTPREVTRGRPSGRTHEIQRLIGRALRATVDFKALGERTLWVDCDVLHADGGTRTAAITGSWCALKMAMDRLARDGSVPGPVVSGQVAAVSVGMLQGEPVLDLAFREDQEATVDMNLVGLSDGRWVEVQGGGEEAAFDDADLARMLHLGRDGLSQLFAAQSAALDQL